MFIYISIYIIFSPTRRVIDMDHVECNPPCVLLLRTIFWEPTLVFRWQFEKYNNNNNNTLSRKTACMCQEKS